MIQGLLILAFCAAGYAILLSLAVTAAIIVFALKLRKKGCLTPSVKEKADENALTKEDESINELVRINYDIVRDLEKFDERTDALLTQFEATNLKLQKLLEKQNENLDRDKEKAAELAHRLTKETEKNRELTARLNQLEAGGGKALPASESEKIRELEELVKYKDEYYAEILSSEKKLRAGVCDAIDSLIKTRGSDSPEYLNEQIEKIIKLLDASRTRKK